VQLLDGVMVTLDDVAPGFNPTELAASPLECNEAAFSRLCLNLGRCTAGRVLGWEASSTGGNLAMEVMEQRQDNPVVDPTEALIAVTRPMVLSVVQPHSRGHSFAKSATQRD
jgi:hypothetical protein